MFDSGLTAETESYQLWAAALVGFVTAGVSKIPMDLGGAQDVIAMSFHQAGIVNAVR